MPASTSAPSMDAALPQDAGPGGTGPSQPPGLLEAKLTVPRSRPGTVRRTRLLRPLRSARDARRLDRRAARLRQDERARPVGRRRAIGRVADRRRRRQRSGACSSATSPRRSTASCRSIPMSSRHPVPVGVDARSGRRAALRDRRRAAPVLLVIDDAHRITDQACLDALAELIRYVPAARRSPSPPADRSACRSPAGESTARSSRSGPRSWRWTSRRLAELVHQLGLPLSAEATGRLTRRTEGWPALLVLAALAQRGRVSRGPSHLRARARIADYLRSELLERPLRARHRLPDPDVDPGAAQRAVCDAVAGSTGSADRLADLARSTILVDEYGGSYRYHSLLREFLQHELEAREPERVPGAASPGGTMVRGDRRPRRGGQSCLRGPRPRPCRGPRRHRLRSLPLVRPSRDGAVVDRAVRGRCARGTTVARRPRRVGGDRVGRRRADRALRGHRRARLVRGPPTRRHRFVRVRTRDAAGRDGPGGRAMTCGRMPPWRWRSRSPAVRWRDFALWMLAFAHLVDGRPGERGRRHGGGDRRRPRGAQRRALSRLLGHRALLAMDRGDWAAATAFADGERRIGARCERRWVSLERLRLHRPRPHRHPSRRPRGQRDGRCSGRSVCDRC